MSAQLLQKPLQVFFCSDEVWSIKKSGVILAGVVVPQFSSFDISQNKTKRQVDFKGWFDHPIGARVVLPDHILKNKAVVALVGGSNGAYTDNLCFFRNHPMSHP
jgi:cephalosporin-C deacetylase-like acetyl esterase